MIATLTNWAGSVAFNAQRLNRPSSVDERQRLVAGSERVPALVVGHSFKRRAGFVE
jgi:xylitol oxidase